MIWEGVNPIGPPCIDFSHERQSTFGLSLFQMEIPLSPTHYEQPPPPEDVPPPSALEAEAEICRVLDSLRAEAKRKRRSRGTETERCFLLAPGVTAW